MIMPVKLDRIYHMRQEGATLQQIADDFGISRQRVSQVLIKHYGTSDVHGFLTTSELSRLASTTRQVITSLRRRGIIQPARFAGRRTLWKPETIAAIIICNDSHRCRVCHAPLPTKRWEFCSEACRIKGRRYKTSPGRQGKSSGKRDKTSGEEIGRQNPVHQNREKVSHPLGHRS